MTSIVVPRNQITDDITLEEFLKMPETEPESEYINKGIYQKSMGQGKHSYLQYRILSLINQLGEPQETVYAFPELRCTYPSGSRSSVYGGQSIVPDVVVLEWKNTGLDENQQVINTYSTFHSDRLHLISIYKGKVIQNNETISRGI